MSRRLTKTLILANNLELSYAEQGDRAGPAVILLHGVTDSHVSFGPLLDALPPEVRAIAVSLRGHGESSKPASTYEVDELAEDVVGLMDRLALRDATIVGHSMGSLVAARLAILHPTRTRGLVLIGGFATLRGNPVAADFWASVVAHLEDPIPREVARDFQVSTLARPVPEGFLDAVVNESLKVPARVWRAAFVAMLRGDHSADLARIRCPAELVAGDRDPFSGVAEQLALASAIAGARLTILEGAGHAPHWERPAEIAPIVVRALVRALDQAPGGAPLALWADAPAPPPGPMPETSRRGAAFLVDGERYLTDGGLETTLVFHDGMDLPHFASCMLLRTGAGIARLRRYYEGYLRIAHEARCGFVLESPTWRSNPDWGHKLGLSAPELATLNRDAILLLRELRQEHQRAGTPIVISGCIGPRGDGYDPGPARQAEEAEAYHREQIEVLRDAGADLVSAFTLSTTSEAVGIARAAARAAIPAVISFTLETDGRLPTGQSLEDAVREVDAQTDGSVAYFMINCAHPTHFDGVLALDAPWVARIQGIRANASRRSHQELDESSDLDAGDPRELGAQYRALLRRFPHFRVLGGCCGTDERHVACIRAACFDAPPASAGADRSIAPATVS